MSNARHLAANIRATGDKVQFNQDAKVDSHNAHDLGAGGAMWKDLYLGGKLGVGVSSPQDKMVMTAGSSGGILQSNVETGNVASGVQLGGVGFKGYSSGNTIAAADAKVIGVSDGAHSGSSAPARLEMYTKHAGIGPGSGASIRYRITSDGDHYYYRNVNGWTVHGYDLNGASEYICKKRFTTGSSASTQDVLRFKRHYWGTGSVRFDVRQIYYSSIEDNTFWLTGHGRADTGYSPNYALQHSANYNSSSGRLGLDSSGGSSSPGNSVANYVDVTIYLPAYTQFYVTAYVAHSTFYNTINTMPDGNSFALH